MNSPLARGSLGAKFDRHAFNDFLVGGGLPPPNLRAKAGQGRFVSSQEAKK
ncbi:MAG TPA: hypothetical protein VGM73_12185 [Candidatus Didemnitutus sp.]|jgi:hypothetical protein